MRGAPGNISKCRTRMAITEKSPEALIPIPEIVRCGDYPIRSSPISVKSLSTSYQQFSNLIGSVVPMIVKEQNWQPMIDTIPAPRDENDYAFRNEDHSSTTAPMG